MIDQRFRTFELRAQGYTGRMIAQAVQYGTLIRLRQGQYTTARCPEFALEAGRFGGRADCVSALALAGVFVRERHPLHLQMTPHSSRHALPSALIVRHWRACSAPWNDLAVPLRRCTRAIARLPGTAGRRGVAGQRPASGADRPRRTRRGLRARPPAHARAPSPRGRAGGVRTGDARAHRRPRAGVRCRRAGAVRLRPGGSAARRLARRRVRLPGASRGLGAAAPRLRAGPPGGGAGTLRAATDRRGHHVRPRGRGGGAAGMRGFRPAGRRSVTNSVDLGARSQNAPAQHRID